ncbi:MAG: dihydropteroate synthase [Ignavibacteria bacterium]|nr:dihydropteroate synthase [Bacteroidota bacterium]MBL7128632.1 dihydropteroate synthase [Ignavibacteria bacterium]
MVYDLSSRTHLIGVLNITPDSFSDGGKYFDGKIDIKKIVNDALKMQNDGADFVDVGGESTRPGSQTISVDEELERVIPVVSELNKRLDIPISIDTYKHEVAEEALKEGAVIVNDISAFNFDKKMPEITARYKASCVLMHIKGTPTNMQLNPIYDDVVQEIYDYLSNSINIAEDAGIRQIIIDVGIGFGKTLEHNLILIKNLSRFKELNYPILLGTSRKSFIDKIYPTPLSERLEGTIASNTVGILNGANIIRVHDVAENKKAVRVVDKLKD